MGFIATRIKNSNRKMRIGIIREEKSPPDSRVPLTPNQCRWLLDQYEGLEIVVQKSANRCFSDSEYENLGIKIQESISDCHILLGVKEVPVEKLIDGKTYLFFSHTIKKQPYNQNLLQEIVHRKIRLIDYECLVDSQGNRVIAFGRWAGIVGAHNGILAYCSRKGIAIPRVTQFKDYNDLKTFYRDNTIPPFRIVIAGNGRVASGAIEVLNHLNIMEVEPEDFLKGGFKSTVYTQLWIHHLYERISDKGFEKQEFHSDPDLYTGIFSPYSKVSDLMVNCIYWDPRAPLFFTKQEMRQTGFSIVTIADITCDIDGSVPATLRATTIDDPVMGYDPVTESEMEPFQPSSIDIMSIDNLPNELPRDASRDFGSMLIDNVIDELIAGNGPIIEKATIAINGTLGPKFKYLQDYLDGN